MASESILRVNAVDKAFGGIHAVDRCSLTVLPQSITGLIGPKGAGNSTLLNIIAGLYRPDGGEIWFDGTRIDGLPPYEIVHLGLTKTWQIPHELRNLTVLENLVLAAKGNSGERLLNLFFRPRQVKRDEKQWRARAREVLKLTQLDGLANEHARTLSGGQKKLLELSRALMSDPALVLLDEPVAGVNPALTGSLMDLIEKLRQGGRTFFLIEHDMNVVMNRCDWVIVMHQGRRIAEGRPEMVKTDNRFPTLSVLENLEMGGITRRISPLPLHWNRGSDQRRTQSRMMKDAEIRERAMETVEMFPNLQPKLREHAGSLSGGEQQMVALAKSMMLDPEVLLIDEPSAGLAPKLVDTVFSKILEINESGTGIVMVEQNAKKALAIADRGYVLETGRNRFAGTGEWLLHNADVGRLYLGGQA